MTQPLTDPAPTSAPAAGPRQSPVLALERVARRYRTGAGRVEVLRGADLAVAAGEVVALVAPSGAGKSTLLHIAGLLEQPDGGEVVVEGRATSGLRDRDRTALRRATIGFVYQFHHLLPEFTALENVVLPQMIAGLSRKIAEGRARDLLVYLGVEARADHRPAELSGGEQQRVAFARAVANAPRLLLADEPTGNLDPKTSEHVFEALTTLARQSSVGALIATHNLALAARMDRAITIREGIIAPAELG